MHEATRNPEFTRVIVPGVQFRLVALTVFLEDFGSKVSILNPGQKLASESGSMILGAVPVLFWIYNNRIYIYIYKYININHILHIKYIYIYLYTYIYILNK